MFKRKVRATYHNNTFNETKVFVSKSTVGCSKGEHPLRLSATVFYVDGKERDIRSGDLLRCDGLPFMTKPKSRIINVKDSNGRVMYVKSKELPHGYKPFQLDSGFWVLRRK